LDDTNDLIICGIVCFMQFCTETYNCATSDYHSFSHSVSQSPNQAMRTVSARPCGHLRCRARPCASIRVRALHCAPMRLLVQPSCRPIESSVFLLTFYSFWDIKVLIFWLV